MPVEELQVSSNVALALRAHGLTTVGEVTAPPPDVLLLHEGPRGTGPDQPGRVALRELLERQPPAITLCGHVHWNRPAAPLSTGHIVNVDARAVLFTR